jgi:hypothetical protein
MKILILLVCGLVVLPSQGQDAAVEQLKKQLQEVRENFERVQREQRSQIEALTRKIESLTQASPPKSSDQKKLEDQLAAELSPPAAVAATALPAFSPSAPMTVARAGSAYMNISFDTLMDVGWSSA